MPNHNMIRIFTTAISVAFNDTRRGKHKFNKAT